MIDMIIIILFFVVYILIDITPMIDEVKTLIGLAIVTSLMFYVAFNVDNGMVHKLFVGLGIACFLSIPAIIIIKYIEKFN